MDLRGLNLASPIRFCSSARIQLFSSPPKPNSKSSLRPFKTSIFPHSSLSPHLTPHSSLCGSHACTHERGVGAGENPLPSRRESWTAERGDVSSWSSDVAGSVPREKLLQVVLVSPQIPGNTGCIARTCAASAIGLHLVEPLGFQVDDTKLKRAGLDYWPYVVVKVHGSWMEFREYFRQKEGEKRLLAFTKRGTAIHSDFSYKRGDWLVFGSETCGLPPEALVDCNNESLGGGTIRIPMVETYVRCLNLSVSVGIAAYEASRQLNYEQLQSQPKASMDSENSFVSEDIYA